MQTILNKISILHTQISYSYRRVSAKQAQNKKNKYYASRPDLFTQVGHFKNKIDFKNADLTFPINIPLKFRYMYRPKKVLQPRIKVEDYLQFEYMSGNEILLYLEQANNLRNNELVYALEEVAKRNSSKGLPLHEHPWVQGGVQEVWNRFQHLNKEEFIQFLKAITLLNIESDWKVLEDRTQQMLPNMKSKHFAFIYQLFFEKGSEEFKKELSLILPIHLKKMSPLNICKCFALTYKNNLMTEYLFEDHLHQIFWKRLRWFILNKSLAPMLRIFREAKYENDEFLWPSFYKTLKEEIEEIPLEECKELRDEMIKYLQEFPSHEQYDIGQIIVTLTQRVTWEETVGGQARKLSLIGIVKNDLLYYKEQQKLKIQQ